jgi:hypothetical protein
MLAGAALTAVFATTAHAADRALPEPVRIEHAVAAGEHAPEEPASAPAKGWAIFAGAAAAVAALLRLIGLKRVAEAVGPIARKAADATAKAGRAVGRAISSPFRAAIWAAGLGLFALTGVGLYDIEWIAGVVFGALATGLALFGLRKVRRSLAPAISTVRR